MSLILIHCDHLHFILNTSSLAAAADLAMHKKKWMKKTDF
jgi:hypothetical protein